MVPFGRGVGCSRGVARRGCHCQEATGQILSSVDPKVQNVASRRGPSSSLRTVMGEAGPVLGALRTASYSVSSMALRHTLVSASDR